MRLHAGLGALFVLTACATTEERAFRTRLAAGCETQMECTELQRDAAARNEECQSFNERHQATMDQRDCTPVEEDAKAANSMFAEMTKHWPDAQTERDAEEKAQVQRATAAEDVRVSPPRVHFETTTPDTDFQVRLDDARRQGWSAVKPNDDAPGYARVCTAPCDTTLAAGTYRLALSQPGSAPLEPAAPVTIHGPSTVTGTYTSRGGLRIAGWSLIGVGVLLGSVMAIQAATQAAPACNNPDGAPNSPTPCGPRTDSEPFWVAAAAFGAAAVVGLVLALQHDSVSVAVTPIDAVFLAAPPRRERAELTLPAGSAPGLGVVARW